MKQFSLLDNHVRLVLKDNVIAILSEDELSTLSGAIYNGGFRRTRAILNTEVPETYGDKRLHEDPVAFILATSKKLGVPADFVGLVTAAKIDNFSLVKQKKGKLAVSVVATAGCSHAESAGEKIAVEEITGTINVIVLMDADPTESCLVATLATAVEAKAAAMRELDIRSRYTGDSATGTITDSVAVAATNNGPKMVLGGPASVLGQLVGNCVRQAVREAINNQGESLPFRSILDRLRERHLSVEKLAAELCNIKSLDIDEATITSELSLILEDPFAASVVMAAVKFDDDIEKGLVPLEIGKTNASAKRFGELIARTNVKQAESKMVNLPPFLRETLIALLMTAGSKVKSESLK